MSPMFFLKQTPGRVGDLVAKRILASPGACSRNFLLRSSPPPRRLASQKEATAECLARQCLPQCLFARGGRGSLKRKPANNELAQPYVTPRNGTLRPKTDPIFQAENQDRFVLEFVPFS